MRLFLSVLGRAALATALLAAASCDAPDASADESVVDESAAYEDYALVGSPAPQFQDGQGRVYPPPAQVTLVEFWGLWCPDCLLDAPHMKRVRETFASESGVTLLPIHTGDFGQWPSLEVYFQETGDPFPTLIDPQGVLMQAYEIEWFPSYLLVDRNGRIVHMQASLSHRNGEARLIEAIRAELAKPADSPQTPEP
jgi:thiol-disulfide isomerase/thioredoxin